MRNLRSAWLHGTALAVGAALVAAGCYNTPIDVSDYARGPAPLRMPSPARTAEACDCYEDALTGGQVFKMYCGYCHNAPTLAERPFSNFKNVASHMRIRANLTGKEYAKLMEFLRRWHDVPPPVQSEEPAPRRFIYSREITELRDQQSKTGPDLPSGPRPGGLAETSSGQPAVGNAPRESR
jgi:hypothetical protein